MSPGHLLCSVREWDGTYVSRDRPGGGVETTPVRSALWRMATAGGERRRVTSPGSRAEHPLASPDGRWIYWQTEENGRWRICRARADGSEPGIIAPGAGLPPAWISAYGAQLSRDGTHLTCAVSDGHTSRVVLARADGADARMVAPELGPAYMAAPDAGAQRVVCTLPASGYRLALAGVAGGTARVLTPRHTDCYAPQFTPDGSAIVFIRRDGGLYRIAPDGSGLSQLADRVQVEFFLSPEDKHGSTDFPAIAPDGRRVAFIRRDEAGTPQVAVIDLAGGPPRQLTRLPGLCARATWSPAGRWLAFVSMVGARPQLFAMDAEDAAEPQQLTREAGAVYALSWVPQSK